MNSSWHQWFDIAEERKLIEEDLFGWEEFEWCLEEELKRKNGRMPWFKDMIKLCPAIAKMSIRSKVFNESLTNQTVIVSAVSRTNGTNNVLRTNGTNNVLRTGTLFTNSPNGLYPKPSQEIQQFELFVQIMAKALMDRRYLDIPLSNEIFKRLRPTQHSHLRL